jgi:capsular exopolysaccharide synthesis family protein
LIEGLDRRIRDVDVVERLTGVSLLSIVPLLRPGSGTTPRQRAESVEAFQTLRASLTYFNIDRKLETVLICSPIKGDGKTTVAINLARAVARAGRRVVVIDMDMRHPQVDVRMTGGRARYGLGAVLVGERTLDESLISVDVGDGSLSILPAGPPPPNPSELISSHRMRSLLIELGAMNDLVIIDSPPTLLVSDTVPLFKRVSGLVVVAHLGKTTRDSMRRLMAVIRTAGGLPLGVVATSAKSSGLYGYGSYGGGYGSKAYTQVEGVAAARVDGNGELAAELGEVQDHVDDAEGVLSANGDLSEPKRRRIFGRRRKRDRVSY